MDLLKSKRFWTAAIGLVVLVVSALVPTLSEQLNIIAPTIVAIVGILIGGYSAEQVALALKAGGTQSYKAD